MIKKATSFSSQDRYADIERFKQALDGATPTVSFRFLDATNLISSDGCWAISLTEGAGVHLVEVKRNGRRQAARCAGNNSEAVALDHLRHVVNALAYA